MLMHSLHHVPMPAPEPPWRRYSGDLVRDAESALVVAGTLADGRAGAFERAARALKVDRSVLRRRVATLEGFLGVVLFAGRGRGRRPTPDGARALEQVEALLRAAAALSSGASAGPRTLTIACTGTVTSELLPHVLLALEARTPPVRLAVRRAGGVSTEALVESGGVDLGVVRGNAPPRGLFAQHLADDRLWLVMPRALAARAGKRPSVEEMAAAPLVLYGEASRTRARVMSRLAPLGAQVRVEVDGRSAALAYVSAGVGATFVSLLPGHQVEARGAVAYDVTSAFPRARFWVTARPERRAEPLVTLTVDALVRAARARA